MASILSPGDAPGTAGRIDVTGNYTQTSSGVFDLGIGGLTAGSQFDLLSLTGMAGLGGTLDISLENGFFPVAGDTFTFLLANSGVSGEFGTVDGLNIGNGESFKILYNADTVELITVGGASVPEPRLVILEITLFLGLALTWQWRRAGRRNRYKSHP